MEPLQYDRRVKGLTTHSPPDPYPTQTAIRQGAFPGEPGQAPATWGAVALMAVSLRAAEGSVSGPRALVPLSLRSPSFPCGGCRRRGLGHHRPLSPGAPARAWC